jgi:hypothetical protein
MAIVRIVNTSFMDSLIEEIRGFLEGTIEAVEIIGENNSYEK